MDQQHFDVGSALEPVLNVLDTGDSCGRLPLYNGNAGVRVANLLVKSWAGLQIRSGRSGDLLIRIMILESSFTLPRVGYLSVARLTA